MAAPTVGLQIITAKLRFMISRLNSLVSIVKKNIEVEWFSGKSHILEKKELTRFIAYHISVQGGVSQRFKCT